MSSDRTPPIRSSLLSPPAVNPDPAYIAAYAASQIVSSDRADRSAGSPDGEENDTELGTGLVSTRSLVLVNAFLDQLLFSFLASSRSTSIASLRPAISDVLKPRLAKEAIDAADEELRGYLAGGDAEELLAFHGGQDFKGEYNLNLVWRRTRLRCMVYTRLGNMEEDDEEMYIEREQEEELNDGRPRLSRDLGSVSPAAAIFLTSILESIGEQVLLIAGEAAYYRVQAKQSRLENLRAIVEEVDMEKIAFNTTLGRLWRSWKKKARASSGSGPRPISRDLQRHHSTSLSDSASRETSISEGNEIKDSLHTQGPSMTATLDVDPVPASIPPPQSTDLPEEPYFSDESLDPESIPLPESGGDLPEEPYFSDEGPALETDQVSQVRPRSMIEYSKALIHPSEQASMNSDRSSSTTTKNRPGQLRQRSSSLPAQQKPYVSPVDETFVTPIEDYNHFSRDEDRKDAEDEMPKLTDDSTTVPGYENGGPAVSTMYDGVIVQGTEKSPEDIPRRTDRGISTYTESSNYTDDRDLDMKPQALNSGRSIVPTHDVNGAEGESRDSLVSSNYSFQVGEQDPVESSQPEESSFPLPLESIDQPRTETADIPGQSTPVSNFANLAALQEHQLRTYDESGKAVKRDIPVLYEEPSNQDVIYNPEASIHPSASSRNEGGHRIPTTLDHQRGGSKHSVPPLAPLQELLDAAQDTSDEASSSAFSHDTPRSEGFVPTHRLQGSDGLRSASLSSVNFNNSAQPSTSVNKLAETRSQPLAVNTGSERAAVQRVSPVSATARDPTSPVGRTSIGSNRPMTPGSNSSKIRGVVGRESGDMIRGQLQKRESSEGSGSLMNGYSMTPRSSDKEQDFEDLIRSNETVKYTLTPQNMRDMEVFHSKPCGRFRVANLSKALDSPRWQAQSRSVNGDRADFVPKASPTSTDPGRSSAARSPLSLRGLNGLRSNPTNGNGPPEVTNSPTSVSEFARVSPQATSNATAVRSGRVVSPRGATTKDTKDDSTRDFADFIRSTGPDQAPESASKSTASSTPKALRSSSSSLQLAGGSGKGSSKKIAKQYPVVAPKKAEEVPSKKSTTKLQARDATVTNSNATADLADFLRSDFIGGQLDGTPQTQRSNLKAQHTAKNSNGVSSGRLGEVVNSGSSVASTQDSFAASKMTQSSSNSRTGLLDGGTNRGPIVRNNQQGLHKTPRDPYALDSDDEGAGVTPPPPEREEESLSDFLRNYIPPPTAAATRKIPAGINGAPKTAKSTGPTLRERLSRNIAVVPDYRPLPPKAPKRASTSKSPPQSNENRKSAAQHQDSATYFQPPNQNNVIRGRSASSAPQLPPLNPRSTSPRLISQNGTKIDSYRPTGPTYAAHVDRRPKQLQAREERGSLSKANQGGMGDLADFLRETEPPPPSGPIRDAGSTVGPDTKDIEESKGGFGRMFGRKKKDVRS